MKYLRIPYSTSTSMLIILAWSHIGSAADITMTDEIEKIEVRHARQPYRGNAELTSLPQSISFVSEQLLKDTGVTEFNDTLNFISGAAHQNNFGGLWDSFALRGFSGDENLPSSYLINGFSAGRGFSGNRDVSNIANIEIWKGPTSALYGRGEPGGTINIVTKKPQFEQQGYLQLSAGKFNTYRLEADYTNAISDNIAFRLNGSIKDAGSFRDAIQSKKLALTPSVLIKISDKTHINYEMEFIDQQTPFDRGVVVLNNQETLPASRFLGEENDGPMNVEATGHQLVIQHDLTNNWFISAGAGYRESSLEGFTSDAELSPGRQLLYVDGTTLTRQRRYRDYDAKDLSARVELSGETELFNLSHSLLFGADFYDYELHSIQQRWRTAWGSGDDTYSINIYAPKYGQSQPTPSAMTNRLEEQ
ncbi:MAG: TonB-dependent receptor plug domain-containing protein, partial [Paraglaciecola sp.]|nr:TonB-dependent receptor plug domain-containing protein [Paraglaciecola sp.]